MKRILIIQTASIGDVILATPLSEKLHRFFPEAKIDLLVKKGMESLFKGHPFLNSILTWEKKHARYRNLLRLLRFVRSNRYDIVVNCQRFAATGFLIGLSGARIRTGFKRNPLSFLCTHRIPHFFTHGTHEVERNLSLIRSFTDESTTEPRLYPNAEDIDSITTYQNRPYYTISPASLWFTKQFPAERWIELLDQIPRDCTAYLLGSTADHTLCEDIRGRSKHPDVVNLSGGLTFLQSAALMKEARMNFTNDSAPTHLASSINGPVTTVFCSTIPAFGFSPRGDHAVIVEVPELLSCRPCGIHGHKKCPEGHFRCAWDIPISAFGISHGS